MTWAAVTALAVGGLTIAYVFVWALCRTAAEADQRAGELQR